MGNKWNWKILKSEYLKGRYKDLTEFAKIKNIPYKTLSKKGKSWRKLGVIIEQKTEEKLIETESILRAKDIIKAKANHRKIGMLIQSQAIKKIQKGKVGMNPAYSAKIGIDIERNALDMEKETIKIESGVKITPELLKKLKAIGDAIADEEYPD